MRTATKSYLPINRLKNEGKMKTGISISFVLPMFNERENIETTIIKIHQLAEELTDDYEIVIVDDASTDGCGDIVESLGKKDDTIMLYRLKKNSKFGGAFALGLKKAVKHDILYTDSDMPVCPEDVKASVPLINEYDIVTGYSEVNKGDTLKRKFISNVYNYLIQTLFRLDIKDINSGYKIVRRDVVKGLDFISRSPFVDVEIFIHARGKGYKVYQYPLTFHSRKGGKSYISGVNFIWATFIDIIKVRISKMSEKNEIRTEKGT